MLKINQFKEKKWLWLTLVVCLGALIYLYKLGSIPPGLYLDEAGTGYNTYSILQTGRDEYGKFMPMAMRLFGSYTPPLYIYLSVPLMAIFDLSVFSTRLLSAISGVFTIIIIFVIIEELNFAKSKFTKYIAATFFAITPWTIFFSRLGYEQNLAFLFFCVSSLLILKSAKNPKVFGFVIPILSLATYADYPQRFLAPLLLIGSVLIYREGIFKKGNVKFLIYGSTVAALIQIPNLLMLFTASFFTKNDHFYVNVITSQAQKIMFMPEKIALFLAFVREFLSKFVVYFSPKSLFFAPDTDLQRSIPELSVFYSWMVIPYLTGLYYFWGLKNKDNLKLIVFMMIITPLPGALTKEPFHIQRTLSLLLPLTIVMAIGIDKIISQLDIKKLIGLFSLTFTASLVILWRCYFVLLPQERAQVWGYGYPKLAEFITSHPNSTFVIDQSKRTGPKDIAYIQLAFYQKLDPKILQADQEERIRDDYYNQIDYSFIHKFANIETKQIDWGEAVYRDAVFVGDLASVSDLEVNLHNLTPEFEILDPNKIIIFRGFHSNTN